MHALRSPLRGSVRPSAAIQRRPVIAALVAVAGLVAATGSPVGASYPGSTNGQLAFGVKDADGNPQINVAAPDGTGLKPLTSGAFFHACAAYSADGTRIAYCGNESGAFEIWTMNQDGTNPVQLTKLGGSALFPDFSPDGKTVVFSGTEGTDTNSEIYTVDATTGGSLHALTSCAAYKPGCYNNNASWSPDGTKIVFFHADDADADGNGIDSQVWVMDADGSNAHALTSDAAPKDQLPDWSPDGSKIVYESGPLGSGGVWVMNADGTDQHQLTGCVAADAASSLAPSGSAPAAPASCAAGDDFGPTWSPDGTQIAFVRAISDTDRPVMIMNADGSNVHRLSAAPGVAFVPAWQPVGVPSAK